MNPAKMSVNRGHSCMMIRLRATQFLFFASFSLSTIIDIFTHTQTQMKRHWHMLSIPAMCNICRTFGICMPSLQGGERK